ncbi:TPA: hypothetical protein NH712_001404 [Pseudomonas aeruginosa]|uniref:hypothetical protein n=2 Tax=Pseudomonas aeruginosa TaxID=287 RepID=UPI00053E55A7|nr:hypothetical protein [Pseudomonas aeruginosa]MCU9034002.1 hypothetical protein [Pseudomonas aeruginosa]MCZ9676609.1 hypothetical protein [Pseudomonas aeruginosa]MCZ9763660.1 hypothetical protein [Pseudomonas aeruginosa]QQW11076.1 hypothetical protein HUS11_23275 [Pseudomonas aeruginosa]WHV46087.1 hypothetical protein M2I87_05985 [Pseudomonas aeruginosa]
MREEFEAWVTAAMGGYADLRKSNDPNFAYDDADVDFAYQAWQASRAALRVELPEKMEPTRNIYGNLIIGSYNAVLDAVKEALQQAGIEVK